jgi:hypothetical protein
MELLKNRNFIIILTVSIILIFFICFYLRKKQQSSFIIFNSPCDTYNRPKKYFNKSYNIVCSCTTSPTRINKMFDTIYTLQNQTVQPDYLLVNIPFVFSRTSERYMIPEHISNNNLIRVNRTMKDYGPATKLVGAIEYLPSNSDTWIIVHDDDTLYMQQTIEKYTEYINKYTNSNKKCAFTFSGFNFNKKGLVYPRNSNLQQIDILEGFSSFCVHRSYFQDDFIPYINFVNNNIDCKLSDDIIISNYLASKNIPIFRLFLKDINIHIFNRNNCQLDYGFFSDALHQISQVNNSSNLAGGHYEKYVRAVNFLSENNINFINNY